MKGKNTKIIRSSSFKLNPVVAAVALAIATQLPTNVAYGNAGYGVNQDISGATIAVPTYYANSPQGWQPALDPVTHLPMVNPATGKPYTAAEAYAANGSLTSGIVPMINTGTALRKFTDPLAGAYLGVDGLPTAGIPMGIPVGITEKWADSDFNPNPGVGTEDYYEIAVVEYQEQMHSDLAKPTRLRGYVQVETSNLLPTALGGKKGLKDITGIVGSEHIPGTYLNGDPILDKNGKQVYFVHAPHYLGPTILAAKGQPVRILFHNYLPYMDKNGVSHGSVTGNGGEMPIPVDESIAGGGPVTKADGTPMLDQNNKPIKFSQNRVSIHWHGGDSPWINDGTPHQWFTPYGDISYSVTDATHPNGMGVGDSFKNVPDMPDPGQGSQTLYFPNNLSGRLMMYHDHASGITKLNAYQGEAAGYVVYDPTELTLVANALGFPLTMPTGNSLADAVPLLNAVGIPLVIQDKTFVPKNMGAGIPQSQDAKWDQAHWGLEGDLFFPHVYETNQDPNSIDGTNPVGRWDWGPWFWPVFPAQYSLPSGAYGDVTATPEAFMDTPVVNGQAYPTLTVDPKTYRFRILSIGNDRTQNLGLYEAVDGKGVVCDAATAPTPNPTAPGQTLSPATCTELRMVPAATASNLPVGWPTDGRAGGVPDPVTAGPDIVQIGNEGGLLPTPAIFPAQPVTYDQNVRSMTIFNILKHQLLLGGGERADILVDFSKYAGKTLILYNDAPAPMPGFDPRIDYFTGDGDQTQSGGAYNTLPGYGPNTRTVMQIKVNPTNTSGTGGALNVAALTQALPVAYAQTQPKPNVPETVYNTAFPGTATTDNYARIFTGSNSAPNFEWTDPTVFNVGVWDPVLQNITPGSGVTVTNGGTGYKNPIVTFSGPLITGRGGVGQNATATATVVGGVITGITVTNLGTGYSAPPTVTITDTNGGKGAGATATIATTNVRSIHVINKAIQELFDPVYGRMNATLAVELPFSSATTATTIPLAYIDAPVDDTKDILHNMDGIDDGETQIWKITHNGVDSHPVHFHMVNVQVLNRVDWAGVVKPPEANEIGWKETLRMNPLEDVYVAVKAVRPVIPFGLPKSARVLDPSQAVGSRLGFTQIDQLTGQAPTYQNQLVNGVTTQVATTAYSNQLTDFDNEYVWHCHILGHEENDFMRPFIFHPNVVVPDAPGAVNVAGSTVTWTDPTPYGGQDAQGVPTAGLNATGAMESSPKNEIGFTVHQIVTTNVATTSPLIGYQTGAVTVTNKGSGYGGVVPTVTINGTLLGGTAPTVTAVLSANGDSVVSITISGAAYYQNKPTITISAPDLGTTATATIASTPNVIVRNAQGAIVYGNPKQVSSSVNDLLAAVPALPANTTSWTDNGALLQNSGVVVSNVTNLGTQVITTTTVTTAPVSVIAFNAAGNSVPGTSNTVTSGSTAAVTGGAAAAAANATALGGAASTASGNAATTSAAAAAAAQATATANASANAAMAATAASAPVAFAGNAGATPGVVTLIWANNPLNVVAATGYTNVTGFTLTWTGAASGSATIVGTPTGATVLGLTSGGSYNFSLIANAVAGVSAPVTTTVVAP